MSDIFDAVLMGKAAGALSRQSRQGGEMQENWADKVAQLSRDKERLSQELIANAASATGFRELSNAIVTELQNAKINPSVRRVLSDPDNKSARQTFLDKAIDDATKTARVSVSKVYG